MGSAFRGMVILFAALLTGCAGGSPVADNKGSERPNVLVIVADDLGYSDVGAFGGEIATPNIDALAREGVRLTHFHSAPSCSPTRAMLLSGADIHVAGLGAMAEYIPPPYRGRPGYEGVLSNRIATLAERFAAAGYHTAMAGKWHLGQDDGQRPAQRGFQTSFALLQGAANHFGEGGFGAPDQPLTRADYRRNDVAVTPGPGFYSSDAFADSLIEQLGAGDPARPFFAYLTFTAPHSPLQAPEADIARYVGRYDKGWAVLAAERLARMKAHGVLPGKLPYDPASFGPSQQSWDSLSAEEKTIQSRRMAVYAAMVDRMDRNIGKVIGALRKTGRLDNTVILFMSDNGPAGENADLYSVMPGFRARYDSADRTLAGMGNRQSFVLQDPRWASAIAAPARLFKGFVTEGGTLVPVIISGPGLPHGDANAVVGDMRDILPTLLGMARVPITEAVNGMQVAQVEGANITPWLRSEKDDRPIEQVAFGFNGQASVRAGNWKALLIPAPMGDGQWHLYDLTNDIGERKDMKEAQPALFASMMDSWGRYAERHGIIAPSRQ